MLWPRTFLPCDSM